MHNTTTDCSVQFFSVISLTIMTSVSSVVEANKDQHQPKHKQEQPLLSGVVLTLRPGDNRLHNYMLWYLQTGTCSNSMCCTLIADYYH